MSASPGENLRIDGARLWDSLMEMAKIGPGVAGGNNRQAVTDADGQGRALFARWCADAGASMGVDEMGNMFATRPGTDPKALPVYVGSHLDTQPTGGRFDGVLGVLAGLEILRRLNDLDIRTRHPIVVVNWTNEEGTRFSPALFSSGVFVGTYDRDWAYGRMDGDGKRFGDELARIGWKGDEPVGARKMHAFFELHIEQGPILEAEGHDIGIVTHAQGLFWLDVTLSGLAAHTGTTPMNMRRDAGLGMARVIEAVHQIASDLQPGVVGTVGEARLYPNSRNVIPQEARFSIDLRAADAAKLTLLHQEVRAGIRRIAARLWLNAKIANIGEYPPVVFDTGCVDTMRRAAQNLGFSHRDIVSGAGHDACFLTRVAPTAMVFCPCKDGLSHNEAEAITPDWAARGTDVLFHAVLETAQVAP
ncbi:MAG: Zn-dependent hydrolase [Pseudomonadota bacterium]